MAKAVLRRTARRARRTIAARATPGFSPQNWSFRLRLLPVNCRQPMMFHFPAGASANWEPKSANLDSWLPSAIAPCGVGSMPTPSALGSIAAGSFPATQSSLSKQGVSWIFMSAFTVESPYMTTSLSSQPTRKPASRPAPVFTPHCPQSPDPS